MQHEHSPNRVGDERNSPIQKLEDTIFLVVVGSTASGKSISIERGHAVQVEVLDGKSVVGAMPQIIEHVHAFVLGSGHCKAFTSSYTCLEAFDDSRSRHSARLAIIVVPPETTKEVGGHPKCLQVVHHEEQVELARVVKIVHSSWRRFTFGS